MFIVYTHIYIYYALGLCYFSLGNLQEAHGYFKRAYEMDHNYDKARSWMEKVAKEMQLLTPTTLTTTTTGAASATTTGGGGGVSGVSKGTNTDGSGAVDVNAMYTAAEVDAMFGSDSTDIGEVRIMPPPTIAATNTAVPTTGTTTEVAQK